ncbi:MAG: acylneuraminate cytidylyltransferase family protein [Actinobacteria bacterium]|nr:acylneuraminate cytidylyltransferase family protein [Actinomycetota bacterium]
MDNLLITICARGGSKGVKGKNIRELAGKPLISYTIKQAQEWGRAKHIVVSTDSEEIAKVAKDFGAEVPFIRPADLATDAAGKVGVIKHALISCEKIFGEIYDVVMDLDVTSPIRKVADLENAFNLFLEKKSKTLFSVVVAHRNPYFNMVEESVDGKAHLCKQGDFARRQDAPKVYDMNASIYIYDRQYLLGKETVSAISDNSIVYVMDSVSRVDIDSELDFKFIEFLIKESIVTL